MRIEMRGMNAHRQRALDLGAEFDLDFFGFNMLFLLPIVMEVSVFIYQTRHFVPRSNGTPSIVNSLARQGQVQSKVYVRMRFGVIRNLREPGARDHQARGIDRTGLECFYGSRVDRVGFAEIVGVDNDELGAGRVAEAVCKSLCRDGKRG